MFPGIILIEHTMNALAKLIATCFYAGFLPFAPGTLGSLIGLLLFLCLKGQAAMLFSGLVILFFGGIWASTRAEELLRRKDPSEVIIDEVVGMFLALMFLPSPNTKMLVAAFVTFRFFDIVKPPPIKRLQGLSSGVGIMCDDILAAVYTIISLHIAARLFHL